MERDDALLSLERHATSKIRTARELEGVLTFGFRGEALPSIASVSRFRLVTRTGDSRTGVEILVDGGRIKEVKKTGGAFGTTVEVRSLFANVPARRKFLRAEATESAHIIQQVQTLALANPAVAFTLLREGRTVFKVASADGIAVRTRDLLGAEFFAKLIAVKGVEHDGIRVEGLFARPDFERTDRTRQFLFLNRRAIQSPALSASLREVISGAGTRGAHPPAIVFFSMDPALYDCNVHPAKREVRFRRPSSVREAAALFARTAIERHRDTRMSLRPDTPASRAAPNPAPAVTTVATHPPTSVEAPPAAIPPPRPTPDPRAYQREMPLSATPADSSDSSPAPARPIPCFRPIGALGKKYLVLESPEGLVLADLLAGRERILYERIANRLKSGAAGTQALLAPVTVELAPADFAWAMEHAAALRAAGLEVEAFGEHAVKIDAVPAGFDRISPSDLLEATIAEARARGTAARVIVDRIAVALSKSAARLSTGDPVRAEAFVHELLACQLPYASPSGRPTLLQFAWSELERKFGNRRDE